ncbi:unnamed protein product, partial [Ectocarpus sp. 13 AM-2016]
MGLVEAPCLHDDPAPGSPCEYHKSPTTVLPPVCLPWTLSTRRTEALVVPPTDRQPWKKNGVRHLSLPLASLRPNLELGDLEAFLGVQEALEQRRLRRGLTPHGKDGGRRQ